MRDKRGVSRFSRRGYRTRYLHSNIIESICYASTFQRPNPIDRFHLLHGAQLPQNLFGMLVISISLLRFRSVADEALQHVGRDETAGDFPTSGQVTKVDKAYSKWLIFVGDNFIESFIQHLCHFLLSDAHFENTPCRCDSRQQHPRHYDYLHWR